MEAKKRIKKKDLSTHTEKKKLKKKTWNLLKKRFPVCR